MNTFASIESLENRQLCSASPVSCVLLESPSTPAVQMTASPLKRTKGVVIGVMPGPVTPAARLGTYVGTVSVNTLNLSAPFTLTLTSLKKGKLSGTITSPMFTGSQGFSTSGKLDSTGKLSTTFNKNGISGSIEGQMGKKGRVSGTFTISLNVQKFTGTFSAKKI